jgi:hypothetical protein
MTNEVQEARDTLSEIIGRLADLQTTYDSALLAAATLAFTANLHNLLLRAKAMKPEDVIYGFAAALRATCEPGDKPNVIYGDEQSGGLQ